jgi:hypothetical protein
MYFRPPRFRHEKGCPGSGRNMLDMDNGHIFFSACIEKLPRIGCGLFDSGKFHGTAREIIVLEINQKKTGFHFCSLITQE